MNLAANITEQKKAGEKSPEVGVEATQNPSPVQDSKIPKWLPEPAQNLVRGFNDKVSQWRNSTILATPAYIVNNSSNVLALAHVSTEILMFKSGMKDARLIDNPSNPINWVLDPAKNIYNDIRTRSAARDFTFKQLFSGNPIKNFKHYVMDTHDASLREAERQITANRALLAAGKPAKKLSLGNPWQTRSTGAGLVVWSLSALIPEHKESDEEIERMAKMRTLHPIQYVGERFKQALWVPGWGTHKREMIGLGYLGIGILSGMGSWRQRRNFAKAGMLAGDEKLVAKGLADSYTFNAGYFFTSVVSFIAAFPMLFALDERKAYSTYGSLSLLRIPLLPPSLYTKVRDGEPGWKSYTIGKLLFQVEDFMFSLIGGATKKVNPDGSVEIVDHEKLKKQAISEAKRDKAKFSEERRVHPKQHLLDHSVEALATTPDVRISNATNVERAMPERVAAAEAAKSERATATV